MVVWRLCLISKAFPMEYLTLNKQILESVECPICLKYMQAPIYVCIAGHSICHNCWRDLQKCPSCNNDLSETRNYSLETVAELLYYPCDNDDHGCSETIKLNDMERHVSICSYRQYKCKFGGCKWTGRKVGIQDHYIDEHPLYVIAGPHHLCWWKNTNYDVHLMIAYDEVFYVHRKIVRNYLYWVVQYIGKPEDVILYYFQIILISKQLQNRRVSIVEKCQDDVKEDITAFIESGYAAGVPLPVLKTYRNEGGRVNYYIRIRKA